LEEIEMEEKNFFDLSLEEIKKGYLENNKEFKCIVCNEDFTQGKIFKIGEDFYDAKKAVELHIESEHNSMLNYLLSLSSSYTGITESQKLVVDLMANGYSDKEISKELNIAQSTIRNHRYKLREKEKQAKAFLAIMNLLEENYKKEIKKIGEDELSDFNPTIRQIDDRFNITEAEKDKVIATYMDENKALKSYPAREKKKVILLEEITKNFKSGRRYKEKEINRVLKRIYEDYVSIRRDLIQYGFLERELDCSEYWVK
jgi:DNA-binding CsgD family transcriptional regulator